MLAFRRCRCCKKEFEAVVGVDNDIYCEKCRLLVDMNPSASVDPPSINIAPSKAEPGLMRAVADGLQRGLIDDTNECVKRTRRPLNALTSRPSKGRARIPLRKDGFVTLEDEAACIQIDEDVLNAIERIGITDAERTT